MGKGTGSGWGRGSADLKGKTERLWMPALPIHVAVVCCMFNFLFPGLGTLIAGISVFCCARNEDMDIPTRGVSCVVNWGIGLAQLASALFIVGSIWSCYWGIAFIMSSVDNYHNNKVADVATTGTVTHVVDQQGQSAIIMQPTPAPLRVTPGAPPNQNIVTKQPEQPPPYPGVSSGLNPSAPVLPNQVAHTDVSEKKVGL